MPDTRSATSAVPPPLPTRRRSAASAAPAPDDPFAAPLAVPTTAPAEPSDPVAPPVVVATGAGVPSAEQAEAVLGAALRGEAEPDPSRRAATERVVAALTAGERAALGGEAVASDPALLRAAAGLRLRLDLAVAAVEAAGSPEAASALIAEVDDVLARVKAALGAETVPAVTVELEPVRHALVDAGVALAGALARSVSPALQPAPAPAAPAASRPGARVLSNVAAAEAVPTGGSKGLWAAFAIVAALTLAYHGWAYTTRPAPAARPTLAGAPSHTFVIRQGASTVLRVEPGAKVNDAELDRFAAQERARGNVLRPLGTGMWVIEPEGAKQP